MKKEDLIADGFSEESAELAMKLFNDGLSEEVAKFVANDARHNKVLNRESLEIGDVITILGVSSKVSKFINPTTDEETSYMEVLTKGDRDSISISRLVGTGKRVKHFGIDWETKYPGCLTLPRREGDALLAIKDYVGKTYVVCAEHHVEEPFDQTFYLFQEVAK
jgi:hypothetical protein